MTHKELKNYLRAHHLHDAWWVSVDGTVERDTVKIATLMTRKKRYHNKTIYVLHANQDYTQEEAWIPFEFLDVKSDESLALNKARKKIVNPSNQGATGPARKAANPNHLESLTAEVVEVRRTLNEWQCLMSEMMQKVNVLSEVVHTHMCTLNDAERSVELDEKEVELTAWEHDLERREHYISKCENRLIDMTYQQEETAVELALMSEGKHLPE